MLRHLSVKSLCTPKCCTLRTFESGTPLFLPWCSRPRTLCIHILASCSKVPTGFQGFEPGSVIILVPPPLEDHTHSHQPLLFENTRLQSNSDCFSYNGMSRARWGGPRQRAVWFAAGTWRSHVASARGWWWCQCDPSRSRSRQPPGQPWCWAVPCK